MMYIGEMAVRLFSADAWYKYKLSQSINEVNRGNNTKQTDRQDNVDGRSSNKQQQTRD